MIKSLLRMIIKSNSRVLALSRLTICVRFPAVENAIYARSGIADNLVNTWMREGEKERCDNEYIFHRPEMRILVRRKSDVSQNQATRAIITRDNCDPPPGRGAVKSRGKSSSRHFAILIPTSARLLRSRSRDTRIINYISRTYACLAEITIKIRS